MYIITGLLQDNMEEGEYNKERRQEERKEMTEDGKGNVVGVVSHILQSSLLW